VTEWATLGIPHAGVIFINERTVASSDFGGLIRALIDLWEHECDSEWANRIEHLRRA